MVSNISQLPVVATSTNLQISGSLITHPSYLVYNSSSTGFSISQSPLTVISGGLTTVSSLCFTFKLFLSPEENYYQMPDESLYDFPEDVNFDSLDDILDCLLIEQSEYFYKQLGNLQSDKDFDVTFGFIINGQEPKNVVMKFSELT